MMRNRLKQACGDESGVVLALVAVTMVVILGAAAIAIDVGSWYQTQRQAQNSADAAALAGAQDLPGNPAAAATDAQSYVDKNFPGATATITTPYGGSTSQLQVTVSKTASSIFGGIFGITSANVTGAAVAKRNQSLSPAAVFSASSSCSGGVSISGNNLTISGGTHSNGGLNLSGNNDDFGTTTYGGPNGCSSNVSGVNLTYGGASSPTVDPNTEPWPLDYSQNPPACTYSSSSFSWSGSNITIPSGVYCATGAISISGNSVSGTVTLIAGSFNMSGNTPSLTPYANNLVIYQTGSDTLSVSGNNLGGGAVFAPNATIDLSGNNGSSTGFVEGLNVVLSGNNWTFTGNGPPMAGSGSALIQ